MKAPLLPEPDERDQEGFLRQLIAILNPFFSELAQKVTITTTSSYTAGATALTGSYVTIESIQLSHTAGCIELDFGCEITGTTADIKLVKTDASGDIDLIGFTGQLPQLFSFPFSIETRDAVAETYSLQVRGTGSVNNTTLRLRAYK